MNRGLRWLGLIALPVLVVFARPASAQSEQKTLTLAQAFKTAEENNLDMQVARHRLDEAAVGIRQAMAALLPQVNMQGKFTHNYREVAFPLSVNGVEVPVVVQKGEQLDASLNFTAPLFNPAAYPGLDAAREANDLAKDTYTLTKTQVLLGVAQAFYAAAGSEELLAARRHAIEVAQQTLDTAKTRLQSGNATRLDVSRAELAVVEAQKLADEAEDIKAQAYRALSTLMQFHEPFRVTSGEIAAVAPPTQETRPEVKILEKTIDLDRLQKIIANRRWLPSLSAFGIGRVGNYAGFTGDKYYWGLGVQLDWNIYDGGGRDAAAQIAEAQRLETEAQLKLQQDTINDEVANARQAVETKSRSVTAAQREVDLSRESLDLVRVRYDAGSATQLDVLQAQDQVVLTEVGLAQARFDLALSNLMLEKASGSFLDHAEGRAAGN